MDWRILSFEKTSTRWVSGQAPRLHVPINGKNPFLSADLGRQQFTYKYYQSAGRFNLVLRRCGGTTERKSADLVTGDLFHSIVILLYIHSTINPSNLSHSPRVCA